jgi:hypothetical protein
MIDPTETPRRMESTGVSLQYVKGATQHMDNVQQQLTRIETKINIIGTLVISFSYGFVLIVFARELKDVQTPWNLILGGVLPFLYSALTIYMNIKFREAGKSGG